MTNSKGSAPVFAAAFAASIFDGMLAGGNFDRSLVAMPAWREIALSDWAVFSMHADLGHGRFIYPVLAIGGTLLSICAALLYRRSAHPVRAARWFLGAAALIMLVSLPVSFKAAPFMLSLRHLDIGNSVALHRAFDGFEYWGRMQGMLHILAFLGNLGSIAAVSRTVGRRD